MEKSHARDDGADEINVKDGQYIGQMKYHRNCQKSKSRNCRHDAAVCADWRLAQDEEGCSVGIRRIKRPEQIVTQIDSILQQPLKGVEEKIEVTESAPEWELGKEKDLDESRTPSLQNGQQIPGDATSLGPIFRRQAFDRESWFRTKVAARDNLAPKTASNGVRGGNGGTYI